MAVVVTVEKFRGAFCEFCDPTVYSDCLLTRFLAQAQAYISKQSFFINDDTRLLLIYLMSAHLLTLSEIDPETGIVKTMASVAGGEISATVGGVSVTKQAQINKNSLDQWLQSTGYGQQYLAILNAHNIGFYVMGKRNPWGIK